MAGVKKLGLLWGEQKLYFVESIDNAPARFINIPVASVEGAVERGWDDILVVDRFVSAIQKTLHDERVTVTQVHCSIPNAMTVLRSFVIPQMSPNEMPTAVEFEAKKYIPFSLTDLSYTYHAVPFTENNVRKSRVVFMGCRSHFIDRLTKILEKSGLSVVFCEPGPLSFVRALQAKKIIGATDKAVIVQVEALIGRILFVSDGIVFFMREFPLSVVTSPEMAAEDEQTIRSRFLNEVQNSIEFYNRSYSPDPISNVHLLSLNPNHVFGQWLQQDMGLTVTDIDAASIVGTQAPEDQIPLLNAFGAAVSPDIKNKYTFSLIKKAPSPASALFSTPTFDIWQYLNTLKTAVVCAVVLGGGFLLTEMGLSQSRGDVERTKSSQGSYADMTAEDIQEKVDKLTKSLKTYQSIPIKSNVTGILVRFSELLPEGVWFKNLAIRSTEPSPAVAESDSGSGSPAQWNATIAAYLYNEDPAIEIQEVNKFVNALKADKKLAEFFKEVSLSRMQQENINGHTVISFQLECN